MIKFFAAFTMLSMAALGTGCAVSAEPSEDSVVTIDGDQGATDLSGRPPCRQYALRATKMGVKMGQRFVVRFAGDPPVEVTCTNDGGDDLAGDVKDPIALPEPIKAEEPVKAPEEPVAAPALLQAR